MVAFSDKSTGNRSVLFGEWVKYLVKFKLNKSQG